jgi:hypothetical protein
MEAPAPSAQPCDARAKRVADAAIAHKSHHVGIPVSGGSPIPVAKVRAYEKAILARSFDAFLG